MARLRDTRWRYEPSVHTHIELLMGPHYGTTIEQLKAAWEAERERLMRHPVPGTRPWAWWRFDLGEPMPADRRLEAERLAELGEVA